MRLNDWSLNVRQTVYLENTQLRRIAGVMMNYILVVFGFVIPSIQGEYQIFTATSHSASPTELTQTKPTLSASLHEFTQSAATQNTPRPSKTELICGMTKAREHDLYPAQALAPGPAVNPVPIPTKPLVNDDLKDMNRTRI